MLWCRQFRVTANLAVAAPTWSCPPAGPSTRRNLLARHSARQPTLSNWETPSSEVIDAATCLFFTIPCADGLQLWTDCSLVPLSLRCENEKNVAILSVLTTEQCLHARLASTNTKAAISGCLSHPPLAVNPTMSCAHLVPNLTGTSRPQLHATFSAACTSRSADCFSGGTAATSVEFTQHTRFLRSRCAWLRLQASCNSATIEVDHRVSWSIWDHWLKGPPRFSMSRA